jgi:hypothetical protein
MEMRRTGFMRTAALLCGGVIALAGCGDDNDDFANEPRPAVPVQITGVITDDEVTVSPASIGAGPVVLTLSNQSEDPHTVTLEGGTVRERIGPINPLDTGTIQRTLEEGDYEVKAGSERAVAREIRAAALEIGAPRKSSSDETLLP